MLEFCTRDGLKINNFGGTCGFLDARHSGKSSTGCAHSLFLPARHGQFFIVIQQMDAPLAQEKKRFEEIHRST